MRHIARALVLLFCWAAAAWGDQLHLRGRPLEEALRLLQHAGLPIVFSSEVVRPSMRVVDEPRATRPRQQLDELLAPHDLKAEAGPGRLILIVRDRSTTARRQPERAPSPTATRATESPAFSPADSPTTYADSVTVWGSSEQQFDRRGPETTLGSSALHTASSVLASDGLEAVQAMPGVVADDDYRTDFSVRGAPPRQTGIVVDGVATPWLQHIVYRRNDAGSMSMFSSDIVDRVTLHAGAYPQRDGDALGGELDVSLKEGSREATRVNTRVGGMSVAVAGEGPIGNDRRGSWSAGVRNSVRSWPPRRLAQDEVGFAFADVHAKLVYDVSATERVTITSLAGRSTLEAVDDPVVAPLGNGIDHAGLLTAAWRSIVNSRTVVRHRVFFVGQDLMNTLPNGQLAARSDNRAFGYRGEALESVFGGLLDAGVEVSRLSGARAFGAAGSAAPPDTFRATWSTHAGYVNFARATPGGVSFETGLRVSGSTLVDQNASTPWMLAAWRFRPGWIVNASAGGSRQFPDLDAILGRSGSGDLVPERATHIDLGIEQRLPRMVWQATAFNRAESDVLHQPEIEPRIVDGVLIDPPASGQYRNSVSGTSRGFEFVVTPRSTARVSGWTSYTYGRARQSDLATRDTFWSDFDRRHAVNAAGVLRMGSQASIGLVVRAASGVPIPGYLAARDGTLFAAARRNQVRLPPYVRLDARAQRTFLFSRQAVTVFGEVLNALNRHNEGPAEGIVQPRTGEAVGFSRSLLPRRASVGIEVSLRR